MIKTNVCFKRYDMFSVILASACCTYKYRQIINRDPLRYRSKRNQALYSACFAAEIDKMTM
jgi:hypothetical protein